MSDEMQNAPQQEDLLERLLAGAAEKAAKAATEEALNKQVLTKADFSAALSQYDAELKAQLEALTAKQEEPVQKGAGRKGVVTEQEDPRDADPVKYLIQKSAKGEAFDPTDKEIVWALTFKALTQGMSMKGIEE